MRKIDRLRAANAPTRVIAMLAVAGLVWIGFALSSTPPTAAKGCRAVAVELVRPGSQPWFRTPDGELHAGRVFDEWETITAEEVASGQKDAPSGWRLLHDDALVGPDLEVQSSVRVSRMQVVSAEDVAMGREALPPGVELASEPTTCVKASRSRATQLAVWVVVGAALLFAAWTLFGREQRAEEGRERRRDGGR